MKVDLDTEIVERALKRAGLILCKTNGNGTVNPFEDLAAAIRVEIVNVYESERAKRLRAFEAVDIVEDWLKSPRWTPDEISGVRARAIVDGITGVRDPSLAITPKDKGPRPYHIHTRANARYVGFDLAKPGSDKPSHVLGRMVDGKLVFTRIDMDVPAPPIPDKKACPHEHEEDRFEDEGGPPRRFDGDDIPKVGLEDYEGQARERERVRKNISAAMGWKD